MYGHGTKGTEPDSDDLPNIYGALARCRRQHYDQQCTAPHVEEYNRGGSSNVTGNVTINASGCGAENSDYDTEYDEGDILANYKKHNQW